MIRDGRAGEVRERLEAAVSSEPGYVAVHAVLAMAYDADGLVEEAVPAWERAHLLAPDSPSIAEGLRRSLRLRLLHRVNARLEATAGMLAYGTAPPLAADPEAETLEPQVEALHEPGPLESAFEAQTEAPTGQAETVDSPEPETWQPEAEWPPAPATTSWQPLDAQVDAEPPPPEPVRPETSSPALSRPEPPPQETTPLEPPIPAPETAIPPAIDSAEADLDELIRELESARIVPDPTVKTVDVAAIESDVEDVVSETLARIYSNQRFYEEAAAVYDKLASQQPARAEEFRKKASEIRGRSPR